MSAYGYGPPPPPPSAAAAGSPSYGHASASYPQHGQGRGGSAPNSRGRGHYAGNRGEYHASPPAHYDYGGQPYPSPAPTPYGAHQQAAAYPHHPPQQPWASEHSQAHHHAAAPIPAASYHPNYPPQPYAHAQYPQQPGYAPPPQFGQPYQGPPMPNQPHWSAQGQSPPAPYGNARHRGAYSDASGPKPRGGVPARQGYEPPVAHGGYGQPYPHDPRAVSYGHPAPYSYSVPPPPNPPRQDGYHGQHRRGRGGGGGNMRGRGGHNGDKSRSHKPSHTDHPHHKLPDNPSGGKKKKRKINTLGLTPGMESESEDDEGEEKVLTDLIGKEALNVKDIASFLAERKKNFPTKARVEAKKSAKVADASEDKASELEKQADKLRRQLRKVENSIKRKREQGDEGDEMRDFSDVPSDDEKPEVMSSRPTEPPPPAAKRADVSRHCKYYATGGMCGKMGKCRFVHDPQIRENAMKERELNNGRLTIQQRLILNDKEQEDLTVLQSIQYLREKGIMSLDALREEEGQNKPKKPAAPPQRHSLLPAASPSLPPPPVKREPPSVRRNPPPSIIPNADSVSNQGIKHYEGWLLQPYGSSSGKQPESDDLP